MMNMAQMGGAALGNALHDAMFGNPQQEAQQQALRQQEAAQQLAIAEQEEAARQARLQQQEEERRQRINKLLYGDGNGGLAMKNISAEPDLHFKTGSPLFGSHVQDSSSTLMTGLTLKDGESVETYAARDPSAAFNEAVYLAVKAIGESNSQDSKTLLEASYQAVIGEPIQLQIPKDVTSQPVAQAQVDAVQQIQKSYQDSQEEVRKQQAQLAEAKYKREIAEKVLKEAQEKAAAAPPAAPTSPSVNSASSAPDKDSLDTQKMLEEAQKLNDKMNQDYDQTKKDLEAAQERLNATEKQAHQYVNQLADAKKP